MADRNQVLETQLIGADQTHAGPIFVFGSKASLCAIATKAEPQFRQDLRFSAA